MTLTTVNAPRAFAKTSIFPRKGLSLKRTGAPASSLEAKVSGVLEWNSGAVPRAKATSSRVGALGRAVSLSLLVLVVFGVPDAGVGSLAPLEAFVGALRFGAALDKAVSNPASSSLAVTSSASSSDSTVTTSFHLSLESGTARALTPVSWRTESPIRSASSRDSDRAISMSNLSLACLEGVSIRDSTRTRAVSSGWVDELNSEALSRLAVLEIVAVRTPVDSAMRITGSAARGILTFDSLAVLTTESGFAGQVLGLF